MSTTKIVMFEVGIPEMVNLWYYAPGIDEVGRSNTGFFAPSTVRGRMLAKRSMVSYEWLWLVKR